MPRRWTTCASIGCDHAQGYHIAKAMPVPELERVARMRREAGAWAACGRGSDASRDAESEERQVAIQETTARRHDVTKIAHPIHANRDWGRSHLPKAVPHAAPLHPSRRLRHSATVEAWSARACAGPHSSDCCCACRQRAPRRRVTWHGYIDLRLATPARTATGWTAASASCAGAATIRRLQLGGAALVSWSAPFAPAWFAHATVQAQADDVAGARSARGVACAGGRCRPGAGGIRSRPACFSRRCRWRTRASAGPAVDAHAVGAQQLGRRGTALDRRRMARLERRGDAGSLELALTLFGGNDTAGELLRHRAAGR